MQKIYYYIGINSESSWTTNGLKIQPAVFAKELLFKEASFLFFYNGDYTIKSSVPLSDIEAYFSNIGVIKLGDWEYTYGDALTISIEPGENPVLKKLGVPCNKITVLGEPEKAEDFLNRFRMKFMSAGG